MLINQEEPGKSMYEQYIGLPGLFFCESGHGVSALTGRMQTRREAKGGSSVETAERRNAIMKILCRRRHETMMNLASELGVSDRTIRRDIESLSLTEPIYTQSGRYGGGVYLVDGYSMDRMYLSQEASDVLRKLYRFAETRQKCILSDGELRVLRNVVSEYSKPEAKKGEKDEFKRKKTI